MRTNKPRKQIRTDRSTRTNQPLLTLTLARRIAQLSQTDLAAAAGVDNSYISQLEKGSRDLRTAGYDVVTRICWALHVPPGELMPWLIGEAYVPGAAEEGGA